MITASANGKKKTCTVEVRKTSLSLNKSNVVLYTKGSSPVQLKARIVGPSNSVNYSSSNTKFVKVDKKGKLIPVKPGDAFITAKANGVTVKCKVKVKTPTQREHMWEEERSGHREGDGRTQILLSLLQAPDHTGRQ